MRIESRRQAILDRTDSLERDAVRILSELDNLDKKCIEIGEKVRESSVSKEIRVLRERVQARDRGDVFIRIVSRTYRIDRDIIKAMPFGIGSPLIAYFKIIESLRKK
ncbi:MAG: hypothetical protein AAFY50_03360 [Cyanobacteria bacterium J06648_1]